MYWVFLTPTERCMLKDMSYTGIVFARSAEVNTKQVIPIRAVHVNIGCFCSLMLKLVCDNTQFFNRSNRLAAKTIFTITRLIRYLLTFSSPFCYSFIAIVKNRKYDSLIKNARI